MVTKIMKHELYALLRAFTVFTLAVLLLSVLARISYVCLDNESLQNYSAIFGFFISVYTIGAFALCVAPVIASSEFYYRTLFTGEGYLAYSLPATPTQQILGKLSSAYIFTIGSVLVAFISYLIAVPLKESFLSDGFLEILPQLHATIIADPLSLMELIINLLLAVPTAFFYLYLIPSVGQLFTKRRKLITISLYFVVSFLLMFLFILFISVFSDMSYHLYMWLGIIFDIAFDIAAFFLIRYILSRRINLVAVG